MKAILIARVSTEEQKDAGNSLPAQIVRLERYCATKGFEIISTHSFDESAYGKDRTEFDRIIKFALEQKEKIAICVDKVDRLSRNIFDKRVSLLYEKAVEGKIELHFVSDGQIINSNISAVEKFQFGMSLGLAKYYSDAISDNVKRGLEQKTRKGEWGSKAPLGYKHITRDDGTPDIVVDEYHAQIVKQIFELYASGAFSMDLLRAKLKQDHGLDLHKASMAKMLKNSFYHGIMVVKGVEYPHRYPPIVSKVLFDAAQKRKTVMKATPTKMGGKKPYYYRGLIRCGECNYTISPELKKVKYIYYRCTSDKGPNPHPVKYAREQDITAELGAVFKKLQLPKKKLNQLHDVLDTVHASNTKFHQEEYEKLTSEQKNINKMLDNLYLDKLKGRITETDYDRFYTNFRNQISEINFRLEKLQDAQDHYYLTAKHVLELASCAYEIFESSRIDDRRQLIKLVFSNLTLSNGKLHYDVLKPFDTILKLVDCQLWRG